ncbi:MAG TPA: transporter substrate-binding domain-containing protein [Geobacteraceae bacterium]|nr:transporter substrate-binding domain-containing protein [Geobacteraceae bacterium]
MARSLARMICCAIIFCALWMSAGCSTREDVTSLSQLAERTFAVPTGTVADKLVLSKFPKARFQYFNSVLDASMAVKAGKADAAAYDEPILKNIAAKNDGLTVLPGMITVDNYGFAVRQDERGLKNAIDGVIADLKKNGAYDAMKERWLPRTGNPAPMPEMPLNGAAGVLRLGTAAVTEPFSFIDGSRNIVGFDIELARYVAQKLGKKLEIVNMDFGALIPALVSGKVDMIAACITITEERARTVLFSEPYYVGGIAALVREPRRK